MFLFLVYIWNLKKLPKIIQDRSALFKILIFKTLVILSIIFTKNFGIFVPNFSYNFSKFFNNFGRHFSDNFWFFFENLVDNLVINFWIFIFVKGDFLIILFLFLSYILDKFQLASAVYFHENTLRMQKLKNRISTRIFRHNFSSFFHPKFLGKILKIAILFTIICRRKINL